MVSSLVKEKTLIDLEYFEKVPEVSMKNENTALHTIYLFQVQSPCSQRPNCMQNKLVEPKNHI